MNKYGFTEKEWNETLYILEKYPSVEKVILFGSRAKNTFKPMSDVDIALFGNHITHSLIAELQSDFEDSQIPFFFDIIAYHTITSEELKKHIRVYGKTILEEKNSIPNGWVETTLGEVVERITKGTTPKEFSTDNNDINYIKSDALQYAGLLDRSRFVKITSAVNDKLKRSKLKKDDILLSMAGEKLGKTGLVTKEHLPANTNQAVSIITVNKEIVNYKFIWYKLRNKNTVKYFKSIPSQSAQPNINFQEIRSLPINLPPLPEQKAIANILTAFDDKIENLQAQNNTLEQTAQTIFKEWFGKYKVGDELPEGWRVGKLSDFGKIVTGKTPNKSKPEYWGSVYPFITPTDFKEFGLYLGITQRHLSELGWKKMKSNQIKKNSIMVTCIGSDMGKVCINYKDSVTNQQLNSLVIENMKNLGFVYEFLKSQYQNIRNIALGGSTMPIINKSDFSNIDIPIPSGQVLFKFHNIWETISLKILNNTNQIQTLKQTRDTLLPKLMSGKVRVNEFKG